MQVLACLTTPPNHPFYELRSIKLNGFKFIFYYKKITELMSPNDVLKAQEIAKECMKSDYNKCGY